MAPQALAIRDNFGAPSFPNVGLIIGVIAGILGVLTIIRIVAKVVETRNHAATQTLTANLPRPQGNRGSAAAASRRSRPLDNNDAFRQAMMVENNNIIMTMLNNNAAAAPTASAPAEACIPAAHSHPHSPPPVVCGPPNVGSVPSADPPPPYSMTTPGI